MTTKRPTKADLAAEVARLTQENAQMRDLFAAISLVADTVPISAANDYSAEWRRSTHVLTNIKGLSKPGDWDGFLVYAAEELRRIAAEPVGYEVYVPASECDCMADEPAAAQAGPYERERAEGDADYAAMSGYCQASAELDYDDGTVYCDRPAGHPGSHHAHVPEQGSEVAWGDEPAQDAEPVYPEPGSAVPPEKFFGITGYVVGVCGHALAGSEWRAGMRTCERCPAVTAANLDETPASVAP